MKKSILHLFVLSALVVFFLNSCKKEELPTLSTSSITNITATSASSGGVIMSEGGAEISARGVCWSLESNPTTKDSKTDEGEGDGQFVSNISGLNAGTIFHLRAYATNSVGTAYGTDLSFTTLGNAPECITQPSSNISPTGVTLNATINANHATAAVTFEYGPTIEYGQMITAVQSPVSGNSITNVSADITGLTGGTTYHYRVVATNQLGTTYGGDVTFTTSSQVPTVTTLDATNTNPTSASLNGAVNANGLPTTVRFEYGTTTSYENTIIAIPNPVTGNSIINVSVEITGLSANTTYYVRAYAINSIGTTYGNGINFKTPFANCGTVTDGDGNIYNTVVTGTQCWIAENLKTTKYIDGSGIPLVTDNTAWYNLIVTHATTTVDPGFCWYNNDMNTYKDSYGALYNVMVARSGRLCPVGWHVPTIDDWAILENDLGGSSEAGGHLKEASLDHWLHPNTGAVNSKGFTALPGGFRDPSGVYDSLGYVGYWWTTTRDFRITDYSRCMYFNDKSVVSQISISNNGFSVRCVKDN